MIHSFFFNNTLPTHIYTLSLHDALPILANHLERRHRVAMGEFDEMFLAVAPDRKSTRLNSSHRCISYAVFCLKKKKNILQIFTVFASNLFFLTDIRNKSFSTFSILKIG